MIKNKISFIIVLLMLNYISCSLNGKTLHIYSAFDLEETKYYMNKYEEMTGLNIIWLQMPTGEVAKRIEEEKGKPQASLWLGGPKLLHIDAAKKGLLESYKPKLKFKLTDAYHDEKWAWCGFYSGAIAFVSNTEYLKKLNIKAPESWDDLLVPELKQKVSIGFPFSSGTAYTVWVSRIQMLGLDEAVKWWKLFDKQIYQYNQSGTACIQLAGQGDIAVGISFSHDILSKGIKRKYPLVMTFPKEGTGYEIGAISLIKNAPETKTAKKFIDWALSVEAQELFRKYSRVPVNPNASVDDDSIKLSDVNLIDFDAEKAGEQKDAYVSIWRKEIGR